jgi:dihydroorotase
MRKKIVLVMLLCLVAQAFLFAQPYNIVIKGGHVIDPKNNIDGIMDIAVSAGKIALVARNIDATGAIQVVDATGMYVTPGLIDNHVHVFHGPELNNGDIMYMNGPNSVMPDGFTFKAGVTTVVDAGSSGWRSFPLFKRQVIDISKTRVLAYLNIVGIGMWEGPFENNVKDMDARRTGEFAKQNSDIIVSIKLAHFNDREPTPLIRGVEAGNIANMPFMVDHGRTQLDSILLYYLRPGDIYAHCFTRNTGQEQNIPTVLAARERGVLFEMGHGGSSFGFENAIPLSKVGFYPDVISTDLHITSMNAAMKDMLTCMDKMLALGMDLKSVIEASTWKPAQIIKRTELGHLSVGSEADIAIFTMRTGKFGLFDTRGAKIETDKKLECEMTIRAGSIVWDLNGIANPIVVPRNR